MKNRRSNRRTGKFVRHHAKVLAEDGGLDIWQKLTRVLIGLFLLGLLMLVLSLFLPEVDKQKEVDAELALLTEKRDALRARRDAYATDLRRIKTDREFFEILARDKLDLQLEGETIYRVSR